MRKVLAKVSKNRSSFYATTASLKFEKKASYPSYLILIFKSGNNVCTPEGVGTI